MPQIEYAGERYQENPKTESSLIMLSRIKTAETTRREVVPAAAFEEFVVRTHLINTIELAHYPTGWKFEEKPEGYDNLSTFTWHIRPWDYWKVAVQRPCLLVKIRDFGDVLIEGDVRVLFDSINRKENRE